MSVIRTATYENDLNVMNCLQENRMMSSKELFSFVQKHVLNGIKVPHVTSRPVLRKMENMYCLAVFVFFYSFDDIKQQSVERPTLWATIDLRTGEIIKKHDTRNCDFSNASYDVKYNISDNIRFDVSKAYYDELFILLDVVRAGLIAKNAFYEDVYKQYFKKLLAVIPKSYQQFYMDLNMI